MYSGYYAPRMTKEFSHARTMKIGSSGYPASRMQSVTSKRNKIADKNLMSHSQNDTKIAITLMTNKYAVI